MDRAGATTARTATIKAMDEITGPIIAITLVLSACSCPARSSRGITRPVLPPVRADDRGAMIISAINAMTLTPSRAAAIFRGHEAGEHGSETAAAVGLGVCSWWAGSRLADACSARCRRSRPAPDVLRRATTRDGRRVRGLAGTCCTSSPGMRRRLAARGRPFNWLWRFVYRGFNRAFDAATLGYERTVGWLLRLSLVVLVLYGGLLCLTYRGFTEIARPGSSRRRTRATCWSSSSCPTRRRLQRTARGDDGGGPDRRGRSPACRTRSTIAGYVVRAGGERVELRDHVRDARRRSTSASTTRAERRSRSWQADRQARPGGPGRADRGVPRRRRWRGWGRRAASR